MKKVLFSAAIVAAVAGAANAQLATWTFETTVPLATDSQAAGPYAAEVVAGGITANASGFHTSALTDYSNPVGNGSNESFSSNEWGSGDYYQFELNTTNFQSLSFSWMQTRSSTGPTTFDLVYRVGNIGAFSTLVDNYTVPQVTWSSLSQVDSGSIFAPVAVPAAANNQALVQFRLVAQVAGSAAGGTSRVDNIVVNGTLIPTPGSIALFGLGGLMVARRRRSN